MKEASSRQKPVLIDFFSFYHLLGFSMRFPFRKYVRNKLIISRFKPAIEKK
ncbi:hypothetical protein PMEGAS70_07960 [Priestia megaterium]|uniref:Uncharacterized protein n=1 Tax=Priestia megaterium TaxID=1404 RepID=A0AAX6BGU5_PRIMG|nr:hypothetical protein ShirakiTB12_14290 [Priestia megaterium]